MKYPIKQLKFSRSNYYQGILQLRNVNEEMLSFVYNQIKKRDDVAITKIVNLPSGKDLYITSQKFIKILGKKLRESYGGQITTSSKLHTRSKSGRDLYRVNVLYRPAKYKRGDIVVVRGDKVKLLYVGKRIFALDIKTGKKIRIRSKDLSQS